MSDGSKKNRTEALDKLRSELREQLVHAVRMAVDQALDQAAESGDSIYAVALCFDPGRSPFSLVANTLEEFKSRAEVTNERSSFVEVWAAEWAIYRPQPFAPLNSAIDDLYDEIDNNPSCEFGNSDLDSMVESLLIPALETVDIAAIIPPTAHGLLIGVQGFPFPEGEHAYDLVERTSKHFSSDYYHQRVATECRICMARAAEVRRINEERRAARRQ